MTRKVVIEPEALDAAVAEYNGDDGPPPDQHARETRMLSCQLTEEERRERADTMSDCIEKRGELEAELDAFKAQHKARVQELDGRLDRAQTEYRTSQTFRDVDVEKVWSLADGVYREIRADTGEIIAERSLTESERQARFA